MTTYVCVIISLFRELCFFAIITVAANKNVTDFPSHDNNQTGLDCNQFSRITVSNRSSVEECCEKDNISSVNNYEYDVTQRWPCRQFHKQCLERHQDTNEVYKLVYDYYCNYDAFKMQCFEALQIVNWRLMSTFKKTENLNETIVDEMIPQTDSTPSQSIPKTYGHFTLGGSEWKAALYQMTSSDDLWLSRNNIPCFKVALHLADIEYREEERYNFNEIGRRCRYNVKTLRSHGATMLNCLEERYRTHTIVSFLLSAVIGLCIIVVNIYVIVAHSQTPSLMNSQGVYKLSLGVADLLVGLIVIATLVGTILLYTTRIEERHFQEFYRSNYVIIKTVLASSEKTLMITQVVYAKRVGYPMKYKLVLSVFTIISYSVSFFTLICAGIDRLKAIGQPLKHDKKKAKKLAKICSILIWVFGILLGCLPVIFHDDNYPDAWVTPVFVIVLGNQVLIFYGALLGLSFLLMWLVHILLMFFIFKHKRAMRHIRQHSQSNDTREVRLAVTLSIMIGVFTVSVLPLTIVLCLELRYRSRNEHLFYLAEFESMIFVHILCLIFTCNSLWNFFVYSLRNSDFRKAIKSIHKKAAVTLSQSI